MQTFLPYKDFDRTARVLDDKRLGNQAYREGLTLIRGGWPNHPASKMWQGHTGALAKYCLALLKELKRRGRDYPHWFEYFEDVLNNTTERDDPRWLGKKAFHDSHKAMLYRKDPQHYKQFKSYSHIEDYWWPSKEGYA